MKIVCPRTKQTVAANRTEPHGMSVCMSAARTSTPPAGGICGTLQRVGPIGPQKSQTVEIVKKKKTFLTVIC